MLSAWSLSQIVEKQTEAFNERSPHHGIRLVGLLFAPPESVIAGSEIIKGLTYFHHRSGTKIDFFVAGYRRYGEGRQAVIEQKVSSDVDPWYFNVIQFENLREEIQDHTAWTYSGEADLILLNVKRGRRKNQDAILDWSSAICCDLEQMKKDKAIESTRRFFEEIFRFVDEYAGNDPASDLSDQQGVLKVRFGLKQFILAILPESLRSFYSAAQHLAIKDISIQKPKPYFLKELLANGDFILCTEELLGNVNENKYKEATADKLSSKLEELLTQAIISPRNTIIINVSSVAKKPIAAMRAAVVAMHLARKVSLYDPEQEFQLNCLRRDILFCLSGLDQALEVAAIRRCTNDCKKFVFCLAGALGDVASTSPLDEKEAASEVYGRFCRQVFS